MRLTRGVLTIGAVFATLVLPRVVLGQDTAQVRNAFHGFETVFLPNGLKVWFQRLPGDANVSVSVSVQAGSDQDPPGREQLAHFTEHMLFSDHLGRTEEQIKREIEDRGGVNNAYTGWDRTFYFARVGRAHGLFAIDWLSRILSPHAMDSATVERQREPVALEVQARPRQFFDEVMARFINPARLRPAGFWEREFGLATRWSRDVDAWRSLQRITPADLRAFYDRYYVPSLMTLTIIGDLDREAALGRVRASFGTLASRPAVPDSVALRDPGRERREYLWWYRSNVAYSSRFKLYDPTARDRITLVFLARWLDQRLNDRLRFGDRKAVYGLYVAPVWRGRAACLWLSGGIKPAEFGFARRVIDEEIEALRSGRRSDAEFAADRAVVARQLRVQNAAAKDLEHWMWDTFYDGRVFRDVPDLVTAFETMSKAEVERFVRRQLVRDRQVLAVMYPAPVTQGILALLALGLVWLGGRVVRVLTLQPVAMDRIRYVARFRPPLLYLLVAGPVALATLAAGLRLYVWLCQLVAEHILIGVDSVALQWSVFALMLAVLAGLVVAVLGRVPRKVLCFEDAVVVKYLAYRSVRLAPDQIAGVAVRRGTEVWLSRRLWRCTPLTFGLVSPGILLTALDGRSWYFTVREPVTCLGAISRVVGAAR